MEGFVSVILPCRDEEKTIGECIRKIQRVFHDNDIKGEIIVSDSSTDDSANIAMRLGAKVIRHGKEGYGYAYQAAINYAKGDLIIIGDADGTYDFSEIPKLLAMSKNHDVVIGSRLKGKIMKGAMPWLHHYIGNPLLSFLLRLLFGVKVSDTQSGFRLIKKSAWEKLNLQTTGMEFASEMIIRAKKQGMGIAEVPISYYPRKQGSKSKLRSLRDGWKHVRFMLLYSNTLLFIVPGIFFLALGIFLMFFPPLAQSFPASLSSAIFYSFLSVLLSVAGYQIILLGVFAKTYASVHLKQKSRFVDIINRYLGLEKALLLGAIIFVLGIVLAFSSDKLLPALLLLIAGIQTFFAAFFMSIIGIEEK